MENTETKTNEKDDAKGFTFFAAKKIIVGILLVVVGLWVFGVVLGFFTKPPALKIALTDQKNDHARSYQPEGKPGDIYEMPADKEHSSDYSTKRSYSKETATDTHRKDLSSQSHDTLVKEPSKHSVTGYAFVTATIQPLDYELDQRFWGWRPNDILEITDNVNNFQLGVLEVTRRTVEVLFQHISRTGSTAAFDKDLEDARNTCFSINAEDYWFPTPESRYKEGVEKLRIYREKLKKGEGHFFNRADNIIPLLIEYEHLLGSCDDNLVKKKEEDGRRVRFVKADNYFYYAKGVVSAMVVILEAIDEDFNEILETRHGSESLHHAIKSCHQAAQLEPWIVTNANLSGILANHRANMATHVSHARFYIGVLIKTLST